MERLVLVDPLEILGDVRDREIVVRLEVPRLWLEPRLDILGLELRLDVIDLERLGDERRVEILGVLLRLGALDRLTVLRLTLLRRVLLGFDRRVDELEAAVLRLLLELPLFRELLAAQTGPAANAKIRKQNAKRQKIWILDP